MCDGAPVAIAAGTRPQPWLRNCVAIGDAATALYEEADFRLEEEGTASQFGTPALERRFGLAL